MDARIRILLRIIDEHGGSLRLTSAEIGSMLGVGEARVFRLFSKEVGKSLRRHLLDVRMARAAELLSGLGSPIKSIASDCGYSVVSNFYRDFKRVHGISPMQMRIRHMNVELTSDKSGSSTQTT